MAYFTLVGAYCNTPLHATTQSKIPPRQHTLYKWSGNKQYFLAVCWKHIAWKQFGTFCKCGGGISHERNVAYFMLVRAYAIRPYVVIRRKGSSFDPATGKITNKGSNTTARVLDGSIAKYNSLLSKPKLFGLCFT